MAGRRRISELTDDDGSSSGSIFGPDDDNTVPGEVLVALQPDAADGLTAGFASVPDRRGPGAAATTAFGGTALDRVLSKLDVASITRLHGPSPTRVEHGIALADDLGLDTTFRVRFNGTEAPAAAAARLADLGEVAWAEPNRWRETAATTPNDPRYGAQWGLTQIGCPEAWDLTTGDPSIVVAIIDTGVDLNHPDLAPLLVAGHDFVDFPAGSTPKPGWVFEGDYTGVDATAQDEHGHGTHVAGTVCSLSNNAAGVAGVCWNVRLMPIKVLARIRNTSTNQVRGTGSAAHIAAGIRWAADHGARIMNLSLGGYADTTVEREAIAYAVSRGVVVVAAMANDNTSSPAYPAAYPDVIAVGATDSSDRRAGFSNVGPHIDVVAPGVGIESTYWDNTYASLNGTSMASPHVAGVAALVLSRNPSLTAAQVGTILRETAKPLRDAASDPVPNDRYGHGLVQAPAAVRRARPVLPKSRLVVVCNVVSQRIVCQPSVAISCPSSPVRCLEPSVHVRCVPSQQVVCQPSKVIRCLPTQSLTGCPSTHQVICQVTTKNVVCQPSAGSPACLPVSLADCPSFPCPKSLQCGHHGPREAGSDWEGYDPYGYDPYAGDYE